MDADLINRILQAARVGETTDWEFKSARGGFPGSLWETYSAMANAEGGVVVLGVRETDTGAALDGLTVEQIARYQKTLWDGLNNRSQVNINLLESRDVEIVEIEGACLLAIHIRRATRTQRPVHLRGNPLGNTYRRRHEGDHPTEITRMLARLCERGFLVSDNRRRWTTYRLAASPTGSEGLSQPVEDSGHLPGDSGHMASDSGGLSAETLARLSALAGPAARQRKLGKEGLMSLIATLCRGHFLTAEQLGGGVCWPEARKGCVSVT